MEQQITNNKQRATPLLIGITGGLATGKSAATRLLTEQGAVAFSADQAARAIMSPRSPTLAQVVRSFGSEVLLPSGELDRIRLAERVFIDAQRRETLNAITHPPILRLLRAQIDACRTDMSPDTIVVVEVPLLFETKMQAWFERIIVVTASLQVQVARLAERNLLDEADARRRIAAQMPLSEKTAKADFVLENQGSLPDLTRAIDMLWHDLRAIRQ